MKMNTSRLRDKLKNENKGKKKDTTFLNYYDLDDGEKIVVRFLPASEDDDLWLTYATHGPNLKNRNIKAIRCIYESDGESCDICGHSFNYHQEGDKEEAKRWRAKETYLAQCVVIKSDIDIQESEDGNPVKKIFLPFKVMETIKNAVINGVVDDPLSRDFMIIKSQKNKNSFANYDASSFIGSDNDLPEEILEAFDSGVAYLYDLEEDMPTKASKADIKQWLREAIATEDGTTTTRSAGSRSRDDDDGDGDDDGDKGRGNGMRTDYDDDVPDTKTEAKSSGSDLRERLRQRARAK